MNAKAIFATCILLTANLSVAQELYLTCEGVKSTDITDRDAETRSGILKYQQLPAKKEARTFVIKAGKIFSGGIGTELKNCEVSDYLIKCDRPLTEIMKNMLAFSNLEINRINGSIREQFGNHTLGGKVDGQNSVQIAISNFEGTCKKTNQLAF